MTYPLGFFLKMQPTNFSKSGQHLIEGDSNRMAGQVRRTIVPGPEIRWALHLSYVLIEPADRLLPIGRPSPFIKK